VTKSLQRLRKLKFYLVYRYSIVLDPHRIDFNTDADPDPAHQKRSMQTRPDLFQDLKLTRKQKKFDFFNKKSVLMLFPALK
jgi:hypothetical protein